MVGCSKYMLMLSLSLWCYRGAGVVGLLKNITGTDDAVPNVYWMTLHMLCDTLLLNKTVCKSVAIATCTINVCIVCKTVAIPV